MVFRFVLCHRMPLGDTNNAQKCTKAHNFHIQNKPQTPPYWKGGNPSPDSIPSRLSATRPHFRTLIRPWPKCTYFDVKFKNYWVPATSLDPRTEPNLKPLFPLRPRQRWHGVRLRSLIVVTVYDRGGSKRGRGRPPSKNSASPCAPNEVYDKA